VASIVTNGIAYIVEQVVTRNSLVNTFVCGKELVILSKLPEDEERERKAQIDLLPLFVG